MIKAEVWLFLIIVTLRVILCLQPSFETDMQAWQVWTQRLVNLGPENFYDKNIWTNYTPGYLLFLWLIGSVTNLFNISFFSQVYEIILKLITNFFDIASALLIYLIIKKNLNSFSAKLGGLFYLANPAIIFNSSVWGQIDGILTFFILLSFYLANEIRRIELALPTQVVTILIKPQALIFLPSYLKSLLDNFSSKKIFVGTTLSAFLLLIINILFFPLDSSGLQKLISQMLKDYPYTSLYAFNFWAIVGWWKPDSVIWNGLTLQQWGLVLFVLSTLLIFLPLLKKDDNILTYFSFALISLAFFLFPTRIHERYLFPFFAFFIITAILKKSTKLLIFYTVISLIHFYNLWYVYNKLQDNSFYLLSLILIILFAALLKDYTKEIYGKKS